MTYQTVQKNYTQHDELKQFGTYGAVTHKFRIDKGQASEVEPLGALFRLVSGLVQMDQRGGAECSHSLMCLCLLDALWSTLSLDTVSRPVLPRPA